MNTLQATVGLDGYQLDVIVLVQSVPKPSLLGVHSGAGGEIGLVEFYGHRKGGGGRPDAYPQGVHLAVVVAAGGGQLVVDSVGALDDQLTPYDREAVCLQTGHVRITRRGGVEGVGRGIDHSEAGSLTVAVQDAVVVAHKTEL